jgi:AmmeMemoRadiSam system protein A
MRNPESPAAVALLDTAAQQTLVKLARRCLEARVRRDSPPERVYGGVLDEPRGAFVTIHARGALRGCLGRVDVDDRLSDTVAELAAVVADSDPRFPPVSVPELTDIDVEISVLTPERDVASLDEIDVGRHGLIIERGWRRGLLLPQVAVEHAWDRDTFLSHACLKAALPQDAWRHGARIQIFEAQVFSEQSLAASR